MRLLTGAVIAVSLLLSQLSPAQAATYYFAANGNDKHACTRSAPCQSLKKLDRLLRRSSPGDTLLLRGGDTFTRKNKPCVYARHKGITLSSYGEGRAILANCKIGIQGKSKDWHISGIEIHHTDFGIKCRGCKNWKVKDTHIHDVNQVCMNFTRSNNVTLQENICHDTGAGGGHGEGFYLVDVKDVLVVGNSFTRLYDEGVNCKGRTRRLTIRENHFYDFFGPRPIQKQTSWLSWLIPPAFAGQNPSEDTAVNCRFRKTRHVVVEDNLIENMPDTGVRMHRVKNAIVRRNIIKNCRVGIDFDRGTTGIIADNQLSGNEQDYHLRRTNVRPE